MRDQVHEACDCEEPKRKERRVESAQDAAFLLPSQWPQYLYIADARIAPETTYQIQGDFGLAVRPTAVSAATWMWGDVNDSGTVDLDDILCILAAYAGNYTECPLASNDLLGSNNVVDLDDLLAVLSAFAGEPYSGPSTCD